MTSVAGATEQTATPRRGDFTALALGALGVVYGDIGTSPLYTLKTAVEWAGGEATPAGRARHAVADRVDAADYHIGQVCRDCDARRQ
jgi:K+ potassium transporter